MLIYPEWRSVSHRRAARSVRVALEGSVAMLSIRLNAKGRDNLTVEKHGKE